MTTPYPPLSDTLNSSVGFEPWQPLNQYLGIINTFLEGPKKN